MKGFKKLAIATAVAALPAASLAMQPLDDTELSGVTGQDGIELARELNITTSLWYEDTDGVDGVTDATAAARTHNRNWVNATTPGAATTIAQDSAGFIRISGLTVTGNSTVTIDAGSTAGNAAASGVLNMRIQVPTVTLGGGGGMQIGVVGSDAPPANRDAVAGLARVTASTANITDVLSIDSITLSNLDINVQLGPQASHFLYINGGGAGVVTLTNVVITDTNGFYGNGVVAGYDSSSITINNIRIEGMDLAGTYAGVTENGLLVNLQTAGTQAVAIMGIQLGTAPAMGNVYLPDLAMSGTILEVRGKN